MKAVVLAARDAERFWSMVDKSGSCWEWVGYTKRDGYGRFRFKRDGRFRTATAHRLSFALHGGSLAAMVCHRCDNRRCVRPDHLFAGTQLDNVRDMTQKGRRASFAGERNGKSLLREEDAALILGACRAGFKQRRIAGLFGVDHRTVSAIATRANWPSLPEPAPWSVVEVAAFEARFKGESK